MAPLPVAVVRHVSPPSPGVEPRTRLDTEREQLTLLLRAVAADLDDLDRQLADIAWRVTARHAHPITAGLERERVALMIQRDRLDGRLHGLASRLREIDAALAASPADLWPTVHVGTCPDCGYPSLGSGLCACCRRHLDR